MALSIKHTGSLLASIVAIQSQVALAEKIPVDPEQADRQAGYENLPQFGGPDSVSAQLADQNETRKSEYLWQAPQRWLAPWYDWKSRLEDDHGLAFGFFASFLGQSASDTTTGRDNGAGNIYRFQGSWTVLNAGRSNPGRIEWRVESRHNIGGAQGPSALSGAAGIAAINSGFGYSDNFNTDLSVINWTQGFLNDRVGYAVGRLAFDAYLDAFVFQSTSGPFINRSFVVNPTLATTGIGALGLVARGMIGEHLILGAQVYDGNAVSGEWDWDTFQEHEFLKSAEIAWVPSYERRKLSKIQFTYWDKDAREIVGVDSGRGWALSASWEFGERWLPFLRVGMSDGGAGVAAEDAVSTGFQYTVRSDQKFALGVGWARPNSESFADDVDDEYVIETSYNLQLTRNFALLPDIQWVKDPVNNPDEDRVWVGSLRAILTF